VATVLAVLKVKATKMGMRTVTDLDLVMGLGTVKVTAMEKAQQSLISKVLEDLVHPKRE
jgi:hypothetical protein